MSTDTLLRIAVSLKGRPLRTYTFGDDDVMIGRDGAADITLDNTGVSRRHAKIVRTSTGYFVEDLGSANGTILNDERIETHQLYHHDNLRIGKFSLRIMIVEDRRAAEVANRAPEPVVEGTTVLDAEQLESMLRKVREVEEERRDLKVVPMPETGMPAASMEPTADAWTPRGYAVVAAAFVVGGVLGALLVWMTLR